MFPVGVQFALGCWTMSHDLQGYVWAVVTFCREKGSELRLEGLGDRCVLNSLSKSWLNTYHLPVMG